MKKITYKTSGVDIHKANVFVDAIKKMSASTKSSSDLSKINGFGSLFAIDKKYKNPVLVSSTDGVGTKILLAKLVSKHDTVGIDLVAMNVNDVLCMGAKPLFFLDYIACGKIHLSVMKDVMKGIVEGCRQAGCALIGGETAEMPGLYKQDDYDLAGFTVGIVEKDKIINGADIKAGNKLIGLASNGLHSNGFSLARKVFSKAEQKKFGGELLKPTRIYVKPVLAAVQKFNINGIAHITGGAFYEKLTKIIPYGLCCAVDQKAWVVPPIFAMMKEKGNISDKEMFTAFNMGIGMVLIVSPKDVNSLIRFLVKNGERAWEIGEIVKNSKQKIIL